MNFINRFFVKEIASFRKLHPEAQRLLSSVMLFNLINPIFSIFINAFLWRQSHDLILVAFYNLIVFALIPVAFYLNGWLLQKTSLNKLYFISAVLQGLIVASLIFLNQISYVSIFLFGVIYGISIGIFCANRNLLTFKATQSNDRIYFSSIEASGDTASRVIIPLIIGWFITFGGQIHLYSPVQGYQIISIVVILITLAIGWVMRGRPITIDHTALFVRNPSKSWQRFRGLEFFYGVIHGILTFVPTLMVLYLVGNEESLGLIQSLSAIIGSLTIYILGQYLNIKHRMALFAISVGLLILGAGIFGIFYSALAVTIFFACQALANPFVWVAHNSLNYDLMDQTKKEEHYAYICDKELFLAVGRILAIIFFIWIVQTYSQEAALRFSPFIAAAMQLGFLFMARSSEKHHAKRETILRSSIDQETM